MIFFVFYLLQAPKKLIQNLFEDVQRRAWRSSGSFFYWSSAETAVNARRELVAQKRKINFYFESQNNLVYVE